MSGNDKLRARAPVKGSTVGRGVLALGKAAGVGAGRCKPGSPARSNNFLKLRLLSFGQQQHQHLEVKQPHDPFFWCLTTTTPLPTPTSCHDRQVPDTPEAVTHCTITYPEFLFLVENPDVAHHVFRWPDPHYHRAERR